METSDHAERVRAEAEKYAIRVLIFFSATHIIDIENYTTKGEVCYHPAQEKTAWRSRHRGFRDFSNPDGA